MVDHLVGIHDFKGRSADELDIAKGDLIEVIEDDAEFGDSWYIGRNLSTNKTGLFPKVFTTETVAAEHPSNDITATLSDIDQALYELSAHSTPAPDSVMYWTPQDVRTFFISRQYNESVAEKFVQHQITGSILLQMDNIMLKELDIPSFGTRFELSKEIDQLRDAIGMPHPNSSATQHRQSRIPSQASSVATAAVQSQYGGSSGYPQGLGSPINQWQPRHSRGASEATSVGGSHGGAFVGGVMGTPSASGASAGTSVGASATSKNGHHRRQSSVSSILSGAGTPQMQSPNPNGRQLGRADSKTGAPSLTSGSLHGTPTNGSGGSGGGGGGGFKGLKNASSQYLKPSLVKQKTSAFLEGIRDTTAEEAAKSALHSGWMQKRGGGVGSWKGRFFTLHGTRLSYFTNFKDTKERGLIDITGHKAVPFGPEDKLIALHAASFGAGRHGFKLLPPGPGFKKGVSFTAPRVHHFVVDSEQEMHKWLQALMKATIERDESIAAVSSCTTPVVSLPKAQEIMAERLASSYYDDESDFDEQDTPEMPAELPIDDLDFSKM